MIDKEDNKAYFSRCLEETMESLYGLALRLTENPSDAEDLVAESVSKAWSALATLKERDRFRPWILRIVHNCFISDYRKKSIRPAESPLEQFADEDETEGVVDLLIRQSDEFLYWWSNPEREFINNLLGKEIMAAIKSLPEVFRTAITLVNVEGFSYDEAAEILGVPSGTVRSRMKRGRTLLQRALWEHAVHEGLTTENSAKGDKA